MCQAFGRVAAEAAAAYGSLDFLSNQNVVTLGHLAVTESRSVSPRSAANALAAELFHQLTRVRSAGAGASLREVHPAPRSPIATRDAANRVSALLPTIGDKPNPPGSFSARYALGRAAKLWHCAGMRIVCPICSATYEVKDSLLSPGRTVRCVRCGEQWVPISDEEPEIPEEPPAAEPEPPEAPAGPPPPLREPAAPPPTLTAMERLASQPAALPPRPRGLRVAWAASIIAVGLICWGLIMWRTELVQAWPPSARLYDMLGLAPQQAPTH